MKKIALLTIDLYKGSFSLFLTSVLGINTTCRFTPSCSENMKEMIKKYGFLTGIKKGLHQLKSCHPLGGSYGTSI